LEGRDCESLKILIKHVVAELRPPPADSSATADYAAVIKSIVRQAIDVFDTKAFDDLEPSGKTLRSVDDIVDMFKFCIEVGSRSEWPHLLAHLESPRGVPAGQHVSRVLAPFMPALRDYLVSQNLDLATEPFKSFTVKVLKAFGTSVMSQKPRDLVDNAKIGCDRGPQYCKECEDLREFFKGEEQSISFGRSDGVRRHLIEQLKVPKSWGVTYKLHKNPARRGHWISPNQIV